MQTLQSLQSSGMVSARFTSVRARTRHDRVVNTMMECLQVTAANTLHTQVARDVLLW